ncbi:MAG: hypothetical protein WCL44_13765 [bacterium]
MKRICLAAVCFCVGSSVLAGEVSDYYACVEYLNSNQVVLAGGDYMIQRNEQGQLLFSHWRLPAQQPTFAELDAIMAQALAWKSNKQATAAMDIDQIDPQIRAVIRALCRVVNQRLPAGQKITEAELKQAIKAEWAP